MIITIYFPNFNYYLFKHHLLQNYQGKIILKSHNMSNKLFNFHAISTFQSIAKINNFLLHYLNFLTTQYFMKLFIYFYINIIKFL